MHPHFWPDIPKANFLQNWAFVSYGISEACRANLDFSLNIPKPKTNPIQSQFKPKLDQNKPKANPIKANFGWPACPAPNRFICNLVRGSNLFHAEFGEVSR